MSTLFTFLSRTDSLPPYTTGDTLYSPEHMHASANTLLVA